MLGFDTIALTSSEPSDVIGFRASDWMIQRRIYIRDNFDLVGESHVQFK